MPAAGSPQAGWAVCGQAFGFLVLQTTTFALGRGQSARGLAAAKLFEQQFQVAGGELAGVCAGVHVGQPVLLPAS